MPTSDCRPTGDNPAQRLHAPQAGRTKPAKISFLFNGRAQKIFSIKETIFAGFASLLTQGRAASHPLPRFARRSRRAKIPSPRPPSFLPACLGFALKFFGGATKSKGGGWG